jgi:thioesterase domain-containing protein
VELPLRRLFESPTIAQLAPVIVSLRDKPDEQAPDIPSSLVPIHVVNGGETLFCFHPLGGGISSFRSLIDLLPGVSIYGLQSEGFSLAESIRHTTGESMARYYVELIRSVQKNGPYWLLGRSSGGHLAFEASRILTQMGEEVAGVMLLDTAAPGRLPWNPTDLNLIKRMAEGALDEDEQELSKLVGDEQLAYALQQLKKRGLVPSNYSFDLGRRRLAVVKNNLMAANKYLPGPYHGHVTLFAAEGSPLENIDVWKTFVPASLQVEHVSGQHAQLLTEPFVRQIAAHIQTSMGSATKGKTFAAAQMIS